MATGRILALLLGMVLLCACATGGVTNQPPDESQTALHEDIAVLPVADRRAPVPEPAEDGYRMTSNVEAVMGELLAAYAAGDRAEVLKIQRHKDLAVWLNDFPSDITTVYYFATGDYYEQKKAWNGERDPGHVLFEYFVDGEDEVINLSCESHRVMDETTLYFRYRTFEPRKGEGSGYESYRKLALKEGGVNIVTSQIDAFTDNFYDAASWKVHQWQGGAMSEPLEQWAYPAEDWTPEQTDGAGEGKAV